MGINQKIIDLVIELNGVAPHFDEKKKVSGPFTIGVIPKTKRCIAKAIKSYNSLYLEPYKEGEYYGVGVGASEDYFDIICTLKEFNEAKVYLGHQD